MRTYLIIIMAIVFFSYVSYIWIRFGVLKSISESYYYTKLNLFTPFALVVGLCAFFIGYIDSSWLLQLSGCMLMLVGITPEFHLNMMKYRHLISAYLAVIFSQLAIYFDYDFLDVNVLFICLSLCLLAFKRNVHEIFWIEILAFTSILLTLLK